MLQLNQIIVGPIVSIAYYLPIIACISISVFAKAGNFLKATFIKIENLWQTWKFLESGAGKS
jgi:hypothetical protein